MRNERSLHGPPSIVVPSSPVLGEGLEVHGLQCLLDLLEVLVHLEYSGVFQPVGAESGM